MTTEKGGIAAALAAAGQDPDACRELAQDSIAAKEATQAAGTAGQQTIQTAQQPAAAPAAAKYVDRVDVIAQETKAAMISLGCPTLDDLFDEQEARRIRGAVLRRIRTAIKRYNFSQPTDDRLKQMSDIDTETFYQILENTGDLARLVVEEDADEPGRIIAYQHTGSGAGIWKVWNQKSNYIGRLKQLLGLTGRITAEVLYSELKARLPERKVTLDTKDHAYVPMHNGMVKLMPIAPLMHSPTDWDAATGAFEFTPYVIHGRENPDYAAKYGRDTEYTWTEKWDTDFNPKATNVVLTGPDGYRWSFEQQLEQTFPDKPGDRRLIWEIINFALRGTNGGLYWFFVDGSNNLSGGGGKSTVAEIIRQVLGPKYVSEASIDEIGSRFGAAIMDGKRAIISNETNGNHKPISNSQRVKQLARQEAIAIEKKGQDIFYSHFHGATIQCTNGDIKFEEKSEALWRKHAAIPFAAQFDNPLDGEKTQRDYIKDDFMHRREVREYVAYKALSLGLIQGYTTEYVAANEGIIRAMRSNGSSVFTFLDEITGRFLGDRIPRQYLFDIYPDWCRRNQFRNVANGTTFKKDMAMWASDHRADWAYEDQAQTRLRATATPEPVLGEYRGEGWTDYEPGQHSGAPRRWSREARQKPYRGMLIRRAEAQQKQQQEAQNIPPVMMYQLYVAQVSSAGHTPQTFAAWEAAGQPVPLYYIGTDGRAVYAGRMISGDDMAAYEREAAAAKAAAGDAV